MGNVVSSVAGPLVDLAEDALKLAEDPVTAMLPETESIFQGLSKLLGSESVPSEPKQAKEQLEALELAQSLPQLKGEGKQSAMVQMVHLLLNELERR